MRIFYVTDGVQVAGSQIVNLAGATLSTQLPQAGAMLSPAQLQGLVDALHSARIRLEPAQLQQLIEQTVVFGQSVTPQMLQSMASQMIQIGRQVNPEYLIKFDAGSIVVFQLLVSFIIARWRPFNAMVGGVIMASIGLGLAASNSQKQAQSINNYVPFASLGFLATIYSTTNTATTGCFNRLAVY